MENAGKPGATPGFGLLLRSYRLAAGLSQEALAERAQMSTNGIGALERGYRRNPQRETLDLLASALGLTEEQREDFARAAIRRGSARSHAGADPWRAETGTLPFSLSTFVGREAEVREIGTLLDEHRLVTLTGAGGVGKTQTALRAGAALNSRSGSAVAFAELAPLKDPALVPAAIAAALGVKETPDRTLLDSIRAHLRYKDLLLVLDNCEHVVTEAASAAHAVLGGCPQVRILATSREPLRDAGERCYRLPSLSVPSEEAAQGLTAADGASYAAIALFAQRARAVDRRFELSDENAPAVAQICRRLDGIPLAIELAAAWVAALSLTSIADNLDDRLRMLGRGDRTAPLRHQTMRAAIDWSYALLSAQEQLAFERLSIFQDGCTLDAATAVCAGSDVDAGAVLRLLSALVTKSLAGIDRVQGEPRYSMLETTRQYALARLELRGERNAVAGRHAHACLQTAREFEKQRSEINKPGNLERVPGFLAARARERPNVLAALEWSLVQRHDVELGQRLVVATWGMRGIWDAQIAEPLRWARTALDAARPHTPLDLMAKLSRVVSVYSERLQDYPSALAALERCAAILTKLGNPSEIGNALTMAYLRLGRLEDAEASAEALVSQRRAQSGEQFLGEALLGLGGAYFAEERYSEAHALCVEARQRFETERDGYMLAICDSQLATSYSGLGDAQSALSHAQSATATMRAWRHAFLPEMLSNEATFLIALDRFDEAYERAMEALHLTHEMLLTGMPSRSVLPMQRLATIAALRPCEATEDRNAVREGAAIVLGYVDARLTAQGAFRFPTDRKDVERATAALRQQLGEELLSRLLARGATIGDEAALALAREL